MCRIFAHFLSILLLVFMVNSSVSGQTLVEKLGYEKEAVLLIINNDDAGMSHASNVGTFKGMGEGLITSATIMFNCPWANEVVTFAKENTEYDFGVHLTLTSEWKNYKWSTVAPVSQVSSLVDDSGYLWRSVKEVYEYGNPEHAYIEGKAQVEQALAQGVPITHIDSHMGTFQLHPDYIEQYVRLAKEYDLPLRMASQSTLEKHGQGDLRRKCEELGLVFTDYMVYEELQAYGDDVEGFWLGVIEDLKPGVTELYLHASEMTPELKAITGSAQKRADELDVFTSSAKIREALQKRNVHLISYRPLLELQRKGKQ